MTVEQMKSRIETLGPGTQAEVKDLTGTQDHWSAVIVSPAFEGMMLIDRQRMVMDLFKEELKRNEVHALQLKTLTPAQMDSQ